jgi:hypothetical protein
MKVKRNSHSKEYILETLEEKQEVCSRLVEMLKSGFLFYDKETDRVTDKKFNVIIYYADLKNNEISIVILNTRSSLEFQLDRSFCSELISYFK